MDPTSLQDYGTRDAIRQMAAATLLCALEPWRLVRRGARSAQTKRIRRLGAVCAFNLAAAYRAPLELP